MKQKKKLNKNGMEVYLNNTKKNRWRVLIIHSYWNQKIKTVSLAIISMMIIKSNQIINSKAINHRFNNKTINKAINHQINIRIISKKPQDIMDNKILKNRIMINGMYLMAQLMIFDYIWLFLSKYYNKQKIKKIIVTIQIFIIVQIINLKIYKYNHGYWEKN